MKVLEPEHGRNWELWSTSSGNRVGGYPTLRAAMGVVDEMVTADGVLVLNDLFIEARGNGDWTISVEATSILWDLRSLMHPDHYAEFLDNIDRDTMTEEL